LADSKAAQAKIKQMQSVNDQLTATNYELELCQSFVLKQRNDYTGEITNLDVLWRNKFDLKVNECAAKETLLTNRVDHMTNTLAWYAVKDKRRWVIGPSVGYGVQGFYVGVGITFRVFEFGF
jgi:division protein CdvB (Snf7/Vps24/ESCRT-III family)